jgi:hypothetical protein
MSIASLSNFSVPINGSDNTGLLMPKLKYRFKVSFDGLGVSQDTTELTKQIVKAARPQVEFENKVIEVYNSKINYAGKPSWKPISISIRDDSSNVVNKVIGEQNQKQFDFFEQSSAAAAGDYKFKMTISILDGGNAGNFTEANILETWECYGCYLQSSNFNELIYSDASAVEITISVQPDNCIQTAGGAIGDRNTARVPGTSLMGGGGSGT